MSTTVKPGYKTTEFWATLASFIFSGLFLVGVITDSEHKDELTDISGHAIESCILIVGQLAILYKYISGRNKIKAKAKEEQQNDRANEPVRKTSVPKTKSKPSTRKPKKQS